MFLMYKLYHIIFTVSIALLKFNIFVKFDGNEKIVNVLANHLTIEKKYGKII